MSDMLTWVSESAERLTVVGLLLIVLFVVVYGVQKRQRWWVPGWMLTDCEAEKELLQKKIDEYITRTQDKLDRLEELEDRRPTRTTRK
jgi:hypothetical protein